MTDLHKEFPITSVTREDLEDIGFDTSDVSDDTMKKLAQKLSDNYCEQLFWESLETIAEGYLKIPRKKVLDKGGNEIHIGSNVIWYDPDEKARDLTRVYRVDEVYAETLRISDAYSEVEVLPEELIVV